MPSEDHRHNSRVIDRGQNTAHSAFFFTAASNSTSSTTSIIPSSDKMSLKKSYLWDPSPFPHSYSPAVSWSQLVQECYVPCQLVFNFAASVSILTSTFSSLLSVCFIFAIISNKASPERTQLTGRKPMNVPEITAVISNDGTTNECSIILLFIYDRRKKKQARTAGKCTES